MTEFAAKSTVLVDLFGAAAGPSAWLRRGLLVVLGVGLLAAAAQIRVPMWPVPITMGTFAVLTLAAAYGARLGGVTILAYLALGAAGARVFAGDTAGLAYMTGGTGGYLAGYVLATLAIGTLAARGWDRSMGRMALALLIGNALIYLPGLLWLGTLYGWDKPILAWGLIPFLPGDAIKLALACVLMPSIWRLIDARRG
ncbi:MAG: biotin transporter BioY [Rhodobacteraceae bacterium]|nr:biotin transporter BioY [Paracoccaceae bacterium]